MSTNNRSAPNSSLSSSRNRVTSLRVNLSPAATRKPAAKLSIAQQLLAKFENKYTSSVKVKANAVEISESVRESKTNVVDVQEEKQIDEPVYESDFETSDSDDSVDTITRDIIKNISSSKINDGTSGNITSRSKTHQEEQSSFLFKSKEDNTSPEESIHENIFTFKELYEKSVNLIGTNTKQTTVDGEYSTDSKPSQTASVDDVEENLSDHSSTRRPYKSVLQSKNQNDSTSIDHALSPKNIVTFEELFKNNVNYLTTVHEAENHRTVDDHNTDSKSSVAEVIEDIASKSSRSNSPVEENPVQIRVPVPDPEIKAVREELLVTKKPSSPSEVRTDIIQVKPSPVKADEPETKPKEKRKSMRQSLDERRRLERMFLLVENETATLDEVEQPLFSPLVMSWGGERHLESEIPFDSCFATPEETFAEMLRLRLRLTRDKMAAEYAAYRTCCEATRLLASTHRPVTLAATRQIISELKRSEQAEPGH